MEHAAEIQLIKQFAKNDRAVRDNLESIRKRYPDQYIAVDNGKVIFHSNSLVDLKKQLEDSKINLVTVLIQYMPKTGVVILY
jgi:hypothetical protein